MGSRIYIGECDSLDKPRTTRAHHSRAHYSLLDLLLVFTEYLHPAYRDPLDPSSFDFAGVYYWVHSTRAPRIVATMRVGFLRCSAALTLAHFHLDWSRKQLPAREVQQLAMHACRKAEWLHSRIIHSFL